MTIRRILVAAILMLALIALGLSLWLTRHALVAGPLAGCVNSAVFSCDEVLGSGWSTWFGIPVSIFGVFNYSLLVGAAIWLLARPDDSLWARMIFIPTAVVAASAGLWFTGLQLFLLHKFCSLCMLTHGCGLMIASLIIAEQWLEARQAGSPLATNLQSSLGIATLLPPARPRPSKRWSTWGLVVLGFGAFACLVGGQLLQRPQQVLVTEIDASGEFEPSGDALGIDGAPADPVDLNRPSVNDLSIDTPAISTEVGQQPVGGEQDDRRSTIRSRPSSAANQAPIISLKDAPPLQRADVILLGNPDAEFIILELLDYTCSACRRTYSRVEEARQEFGDRLAVALLPMSMERSCNPIMVRDMASHRNACKLARLSLAIWEVAPDRFEELHNWLMQTESYQDYSAAWEFATDLVDTDQLLTAISSQSVEEQLNRNIRYWDRLGQRLPTLVLGKKLVQGELQSDAQLVELIREAFRSE